MKENHGRHGGAPDRVYFCMLVYLVICLLRKEQG